MSNLKINFAMSLDEMKSEIQVLSDKWKSQKSKCKYPKFVEGYFKEFNKQYLLSKGGDFVAEIKIIETFNILKSLVKTPEKINLGKILLFSETSDRIKIFKTYSPEMDDKTYWEELRLAYQMQDYKKLNHKLLASLFLSDRSAKENISSKIEQTILNSLPPKVTIYRVCYLEEIKTKKYGISWTLDKSVADFFANRLTKKVAGQVATLIIPKDRIIAYFKDRKEEEIIYIPDWLIKEQTI